MKTNTLLRNAGPAPVRLNKPVKEAFTYYNLSQLKAMSRGNDTFVKTIVNHFIEHTPPIISKLMACRDAGDWAGMGKAAHQVKQSIFAMEIDLLKAPVVDIVNAGRAGQPVEKLAEKADLLKQVIDQVIEDLKKEFN